MIVCHCQSITDHDIDAAIRWMRAADAEAIITPGRVYRALGKRPDCGGCLPLFLDKMLACDSFQVSVADAPRGPIPVLAHRTQTPNAMAGQHYEGRSQGYRLPERGAPVGADSG
jgi:bacterioferritin-associated ferredoxin